MSATRTQGHFQQSNAQAVSGEQLEVLGKTAATQYLSGAAKTLTEAVTQTVKKASLAPEQVKRVIEFANTEAFLREFKKEGAGHHVVEFTGGPADPSEILKELNAGGGGTVFDRGTLDYQAPPRESKIASAAEEEGLDRMFAVEASALPFSEPLGEALALRDKFAAMCDHLTAELSGLEGAYADLSDHLYFEVKQAALAGNPLGHVAQAMASSGVSEETMKCAFQMLTPRLLREGVFLSADAALASMDKEASAVQVNGAHPLVAKTREYGECLRKLAQVRPARDLANQHYGELTHFVKNAEGLLPRAARHATDTAKKVAPHVGALAGKAKKHLLGGKGESTRSVVESMVEHAPHALAGAATLEGARRLSNAPSVRTAYHGAQAHLNPTSDQWKYETARQRGEV